MKNVFCLVACALMLGCGEGAPPELTPEKKVEMDAKMATDMKSMMGDMQKTAPPGTPAPKAK